MNKSKRWYNQIQYKQTYSKFALMTAPGSYLILKLEIALRIGEWQLKQGRTSFKDESLLAISKRFYCLFPNINKELLFL